MIRQSSIFDLAWAAPCPLESIPYVHYQGTPKDILPDEFGAAPVGAGAAFTGFGAQGCLDNETYPITYSGSPPIK